MAHVLQSNVKGRDIVARVGEEFAELLLQASSAGALALAEQIRLSMAEQPGLYEFGGGRGRTYRPSVHEQPAYQAVTLD